MLNIKEKKQLIQDMEEVVEAIEACNAGLIDFDEVEAAYWEERRRSLLEKCHKAIYPENVIPFS